MFEEKQVSLEDVVKMLQSMNEKIDETNAKLDEKSDETNAKLDNLSESHYELRLEVKRHGN